jgi:hypothetical protein
MKAEDSFKDESELAPPRNPAPSPTASSKRESVRSSLVGLTQLAQKAYKEKRRKDCLALANAILKVDPDDVDAHRLKSLIESDIEAALLQVEDLLNDPHWKTEEILRSKATLMLQSILEIEPQNTRARTLFPKLQSAETQNQPRARRDPFAGSGIDQNSNPLEVREPDDGRLRNHWIRRAFFIVAILLGVAAILFHYW